jgi:iron complex transport system substrate-binding protein/vitamin B12 transport system substrate-binding protein
VLEAVGAREDLVGIDRFSHRLPGLEALPSVGGLYSPDLERIVALGPTLVIAVRTEEQGAVLASLRARGVRVAAIEPYTLDEVLRSFVAIGRLVGRESEGRQLSSRVRSELDRVRRSASSRRPVTTALVLERDPLYVAGGGSFADDLIEIAGGVNVFSDLPSPYPRVSLEVLASRAPDVIVDTALDLTAPEAGEREARRFWSRFPWAGRIEVVPRGAVTLPGPDLGEAARQLYARLGNGPSRRSP